MKTMKTKLVLALLLLIAHSSLKAQFLKQLVNSVKQTGQNRADDKTNQATNKAIDKISGKNQAGDYGDSAATNSVLGAFAKAAADNPNDTSAADLTMKALGLLTGGGGVSAADSAAAIKSFMTASSGSGFLYHYINNATSKNGTSTDTTAKFITNNGNGRSEMRINIPGASTNKMITIAHAGQPKYSVSLYTESKTYSLNVIDTSLINSNMENYQVTKIGNETVQGYNCIHSKIVSTMGRGMFKSSSTSDIWTSTDVPGYALYKKMMTAQNVTPKMMRALQQAGADGMFVKMQVQGKEYSMTMLLISAEQKTFPASLFMIPAGYSQSQYNMIYHMMPGVKN